MIEFIPFSGFLGAGKTTTLVAAARVLEGAGRTVAVITNDQGTDLVDTRMARTDVSHVGEVTGGCFCCRFEDLVEVIRQVVDGTGVDTVLAESVGSCTDLQATVVRPMRKYYGDKFRVAPLTTVVDPLRYTAFQRAMDRGDVRSDLVYLFDKQLTEADVIACNKVDLVNAEQLAGVVESLRRSYPNAVVVPYSARSGTGLAELVAAWADTTSRFATDLEIDYDRYANAEAGLAWLNQSAVLTAPADGTFDGDQWANELLTHLGRSCDDTGALVGHVKVAVDSPAGSAKVSIVGDGRQPHTDLTIGAPVEQATATVNARVLCEPDELDRAVAAAMHHADQLTGANSVPADAASFKPGYPTPIHRLAATEA